MFFWRIIWNKGNIQILMNAVFYVMMIIKQNNRSDISKLSPFRTWSGIIAHDWFLFFIIYKVSWLIWARNRVVIHCGFHIFLFQCFHPHRDSYLSQENALWMEQTRLEFEPVSPITLSASVIFMSPAQYRVYWYYMKFCIFRKNKNIEGMIRSYALFRLSGGIWNG